jgi:hypothetical protein
MIDLITILTADRDDGDGIFVTFSDGTCAGYVATELVDLRPNREMTSDQIKPVSEQSGPDNPSNGHILYVNHTK